MEAMLPGKAHLWCALLLTFGSFPGVVTIAKVSDVLVAASAPPASYDVDVKEAIRTAMPVSTELQCPAKTRENSSSTCRCTPLRDIQCSHLNVIPLFVPDGKEYNAIYMAQQNITRLPAGGFNSIKISKIVIDLNPLKSNISPDSLMGLANRLEELSMGGCEIDALPSLFLQNMSKLKRLYLWRNQLTGLPDNFFRAARYVEELSLWGNRINALTGKTFKRLRRLKKLDLEENNISKIDSNIFDDLVRLEVLNLGHNKLTVLSDSTFSRMSKLKALSLDGNELILPGDEVFKGLNMLMSLDLRDNRIALIPNQLSRQLGNLTHLYLQNNRISQLWPALFEGLVSLQYLDLSRNIINRDVKDGLFKSLVSLYHLYLDFNDNLVKFPESALPPNNVLKTLSFVGSPIACNCSDVSSYYLGQLWRSGTTVWGMCGSHPTRTATAAIGDPNTYENVPGCPR